MEQYTNTHIQQTFLHNTPNQPTKFSTMIWVKINNDSRGTYNVNSDI